MKLDMQSTAEKIKSFFGDTVNQVAGQTKFVQRQSKLDGLKFLQILVFGFIENPKGSLNHLAQVSLDLGVEITPQGIDERINEHSVVFLKRLFNQAMETFKNDQPLPLQVLQQFRALNIIDSSVKALPDNMLEEYPGCGGDGPQASLKVQLMFEFLYGNLKQVVLQSGRTPDQAYKDYLQFIEAGSLTIVDLGYFSVRAFGSIADQKAYFLSRYLYDTRVYTLDGEKIDLLSTLRSTTANSVDLDVYLSSKQRLRCRLIAVRAPQEVADHRRQKAIKNAQCKGRTPGKVYLALMDWTIFVTNVPSTMLAVVQVVLLYRVRWQIELVFKLWKSYCGLGRIAGVRRERVLTELYAKMIGIVLTHFLIAPLRMPEGAGVNREISPVQVRQILRRFACQMNQALTSLDALVNVLEKTVLHITRFGFKQKREKNPNVCYALDLVATFRDLTLLIFQPEEVLA
jgi:hypothetical protein